MNKFFSLLAIGGALLGSSFLSASNTAIVTVTFNILAENDIFFSGNPGTFNLTPGNSPQTDNSTTYTVTTNQTNQTITGEIGAALASGVSLSVDLTAPTGATSNGLTSLSTTPANLVTGITTLNESGLGVIYSMSVTPAAATGGPFTSTITYTIL